MGDLRQRIGGRVLRRHTLIDRILVGTGERSKDQLARVWMTDWHLKSRAFLSNGLDRANIAKIQARINTLGIHIERYSNYIHAARTLAVTEECALYAIRTGQQAQFSAGDSRAAIIVRVQADDSCFAIAQVAAEPFDLVCMNIRRRDFNGDRKVQDDLVLGSWLPHVNNSFADLKGEIDFS